MSDVEGYDFRINGVGYDAAEDAEGQHYVENGEPMRPPNALTVQGENQQKFQLRPDTLQWSLTDWSGGMGQEKFDITAPNRWRELIGVRAFDTPGKLVPGYYAEVTQDSTGAADFEAGGALAVMGETLVAVGKGGDFKIYMWDGSKWDAGTNWSGGSLNAYLPSVAGFEDGVVFLADSSDDLYLWNGSGTATQIDSGGMNTGGKSVHVLEPYVYVYEAGAGSSFKKVWEVALDGSTEELITEVNTGYFDYVGSKMTGMNGKLYLCVDGLTGTTIWEITPSSAAGTGFGVPVGTLHGVRPVSVWSHMNLLFILGRMGSEEVALFYFDPNGTYGTLGKLSLGVNTNTQARTKQNSSFLSHFFTLPSISTTLKHPLVQVDAVSGGFAVLSYNEDGDATDDATPTSVVVFGDDIFWTVPADVGSPATVFQAQPDNYVKSSWAISPWNDYGLADDKILTSLVLSCEALPADWTVYVDYAKDGGTSWTNVITYTTDGGTGTRAVVSTDSSTIKFGTLSVRIRMVYTGAGVPTSSPVVLGVDANATVAKQVNTWQLLLNLSTDRGHPGDRGATKITNLKTAAATGNVVQFDNGYGSDDPGVYSEHDVIIDQFQMILSQPGEGVAAVIMREVT